MHLSKDCHQEIYDRACWTCGVSGHLSRDCPGIGNAAAGSTNELPVSLPCTLCKDPGHSTQDCTTEVPTCSSCNVKGHLAEECMSQVRENECSDGIGMSTLSTGMAADGIGMSTLSTGMSALSTFCWWRCRV